MIYKNESLPNYTECLGETFPDRIVVNNQVQGRMSSIKHAMSGVTWCPWWIVPLPRNCPWFHHLQMNLLRYYENHLLYSRLKASRHYEEFHIDIVKNSIDKLTRRINEDNEAATDEDLGC